MKVHVEDINKLFEQGLVTKSEVLKVRVQYSTGQLKTLEAKNAVQLAALALKNTIGITLSTEIELASPMAPESGPPENLRRLTEQALGRRSEIRSMDLRTKAGEAGLTLARSGWFPQIYLTGNYLYARPNPRLLPAQDKYFDTWDLGLSVSFDIWNWGSTLHQTDQAEAKLQQARTLLEQTKDAIVLDVSQAYYSFQQSLKRIQISQEGAAQAEEQYRITKERFRQGTALNAELLDAETASLEAKTNHLIALVDHHLSKARLDLAIGGE